MNQKMTDLYPVQANMHLLDYKHKMRQYYDAPDGEDLIGKLLYTNKIMIPLSWGLGCQEFVNKDAFQTPRNMLFTCLKYTVPAIGMATTFTTITYLATKLRKSDDYYNYMLGGAAAGVISGMALRSMKWGTLLVLGLAIAGGIKKHAVMNNSTILTFYCKPFEKVSNYYQKNFNNFTIVRDRRGNWQKAQVNASPEI